MLCCIFYTEENWVVVSTLTLKFQKRLQIWLLTDKWTVKNQKGNNSAINPSKTSVAAFANVAAHVCVMLGFKYFKTLTDMALLAVGRTKKQDKHRQNSNLPLSAENIKMLRCIYRHDVVSNLNLGFNNIHTIHMKKKSLLKQSNLYRRDV